MAPVLTVLTAEELLKIRPFLEQFAIDGEVLEVQRLVQGHLHETYVGSWALTSGVEKRFVHQRINAVAFPQTESMLSNVATVIGFLDSVPDNSFPEKLKLVFTKEGHSFLKIDQNYWRTVEFVEGSEAHDRCPSVEHGYALGRASAHFISLLSGLPAHILENHLPDFQDTDARISELEQSLKGLSEDHLNRGGDLMNELLKEVPEAAQVSRALKTGAIPSRVIHFDTKVNNFLFASGEAQVLCMVDLDLCMEGTGLFDFGDLVRSACMISREDESDPSEVRINTDLVKAITQGFLEEPTLELQPSELELLDLAPMSISFNLTTRFLTDYFRGDRYFPVSRPEHNLERARAQWRVTQLLKDARDLIAENVASLPL